MTSIRARLLLSLLLTLAAAALVIGTVTYRSALAGAEQLFDYQLRQMALSLRDQGEMAAGDAAALGDEDLDFVVQIWSLDGRSVYATRAHRNLPLQTVLGLAEVAVDGQRWRTFGVAARGRVIQVAQPVRIRQRLATDAALHSVLPLAATAPLLAALMWWLIARSLRPLSRVAADVRARGVAALAPLPTAGLPDEVAPLVGSLNSLLARLDEAMAGQRAFVADAAHELRSPLTALKLQAQGVKRAPDDASRGQAVEALVAGVDRAVRLVEQLLALARHEPGGHRQPMQPVALAELLRQVLVEAAPQAQAQGVQVSLDADDAIQVDGDPAALAVLVRNLVDNAMRYGVPPVRTGPGAQGVEPGARRVGLADRASQGGQGGQGGPEPNGRDACGQIALHLTRTGDQALLQVDDSGLGIAPADRERVFDRFVRGGGAAQAPGSGLGLAIVRSIAQRHGASVDLAESPLGGLRVEVRWPALGIRT